MKHEWRNGLRRLTLSLLLAWFIGYIFDQVTFTIIATLSVIMVWQFRQLYRLQKWLLKDSGEPPESSGIWGSVFDDIYKLMRHQQRSQNRLKALLKRVQDSTEALKDGVLMVDSNGNLEWWNPAASELLGLSERQDLRQPISNLVRSPEFRAYFDNKEYDEPLDLLSPINQIVQLQFHITLFGSNDRLIICRDITHLKYLEAMRQDFVANASHELRTPLTVISGYLETFIDHKDMLPERWARALSQMHKQGLRMQDLITDLLLLSRIEGSTDQKMQCIDVPELLLQIQEDARVLSAHKQHSIHLQSEAGHMSGIHSELSSAFSNLIFNAVKYTPEKGEIHIRWWQDSFGFHLSIKDNGLGIEQPHLPRLTERFYRADASRHSETGGTGLGLAIVKHVLLHHEGELKIESTVGEGSCFCCHFPLKRQCELDS